MQVTDEEFTGGLEAVVVDAIASEEDQKKAELIIKEAENEAGNILEAAKEEAKVKRCHHRECQKARI